MKQNQKLVGSLSAHLFWDIDRAAIDERKHARQIIEKVLILGLYSDFKKIVRFYQLEEIVKQAVKMRALDKRTASFLSLVSGKPKSNFLCYSTEQSAPKHWNF